ncbi:MAG: thioredoxin family protein [Gemmatimonadales bacterium]|nr:thioredoxin family protein [Candidatus Palauibacter irciniicola]MYC17258.1 thioredoxin family protein [Gemmatimonadales bacterium]
MGARTFAGRGATGIVGAAAPAPTAARGFPSLNRNRFHSAPTFSEYLETVEKNRELWHALARRAVVDEETRQRARAIPGRWNVIALTEDWCGDAINTLPVFDRLAESAGNIELRVLLRDENPDLMDAHLTNGTSRSIPVLIVYDEALRERGWWGPRPAPIQEWVMTEGMKLDTADRYREVRRYYARDKGRTALDEFLRILERAAAGD